MSNMKKATIREVQHNLSKVLQWVEDGEEVQVTRRDRIVAKIVPADRGAEKPKWPDFSARAEAIWGKRPRGKSASAILIEDRKERM
jgi:antitoxin (DNA-binding transcriptional repressor) of toxin-antitoxin stability system